MSDEPSTTVLVPDIGPSTDHVGEVPTTLTPNRREQPHSLLAYPATYTLLGLNAAVFLLMLPFGPATLLWHQHAYGAILTAPFDMRVLLLAGSSAPDSLSGTNQWWRLITANFVHVTPLHLLLNMWCLWNLGLFGEPLLGQTGLVAVYVLTGVAGMLQSAAFGLFTKQWSVTAGASGAIFGIAGILIVLLSNRRLALPWAELRSLRRQVIFFAVANLVIGMAPALLAAFSPHHLRATLLDPSTFPHVDNSAHLGGFFAGLALGVPLFPRMTSGRSSYRVRQAIVFSTAALLLCLLCYALTGVARPAGPR